MSRSTRQPWYTDGYKGSKRKQYYKRYANHVIRHTDDIPDGKAYCKFFDTWSICDYRFRYNPKPYVYFSWVENKFVLREPSPIWRVARK